MNVNPPIRTTLAKRGFALVITLSLMVLLTVIAVGLLSLGAVSLRGSAGAEARALADANARMAVLLAIGELQKAAGDDRRITADAAIRGDDMLQPELVGVWRSWSPGAGARPDGEAPDYDKPKEDLFEGWLVSAPDSTTTKDQEWAETPVPEGDPEWVRLFSREENGFDFSARSVALPQGTMAWGVTQENTKAKVNVGGTDAVPEGNVALHAQRRPSLGLSGAFKQPEDGWNLRAGRVISTGQMGLDEALVADGAAVAAAGGSFTVHAEGLLTDAVRGGLKTDLSLGFELGDADFSKPSWGETPNPFRAQEDADGFATPGGFEGQRALFRPLVENPVVPSKINYSVASISFRFYAAAVPTFDHLRSYYRMPHHLYGGERPVVAERGPDHVAAVTDPAARKTYLPPGDAPPGDKSVLSVRPVLNRMLYLLSSKLDAEDQVQLVITPVISLWNPYNTRLEIEGAVAYPWMDLPFQLIWERKSPNSPVVTEPIGFADAMGKQFEASGQSRQVDPYFFCELTANGDGDVSKPILFEPGEVRVFYPASQQPVDFIRKGSNAQRTLRMRPAEDISGVNKRGGFQVSMQQADGLAGHGLAKYKVQPNDTIRVSLKDLSAQASDPSKGIYHYFVSLEDAARIKNPSDTTRGETVTDVQILNLVSAVNTITSPWRSYGELKAGDPTPFGVIETYHRTAKSNVGAQPVADLIYTTNPRQPSINHMLANGSFTVAPHFQSTLRSTPSFDVAIQTSFDGRTSFWGPSHSSSGEGQLPFFEVPRQPLLSLAGFQHADLSSSTFAPAHQFGNSWASAYLGRDKTALVMPGGTQLPTVPVYDTCYLVNEALWDGFFFSGAAPRLSPASSGNPATAWKQPIAAVRRTLEQVVREFVADPVEKPLGNPRMRLNKGGLPEEQLVEQLLDPAGCTRIAAHLTMDGAFNINSTKVEAWVALLAGLRGEAFEVEGGDPAAANASALPRFRFPTGSANDAWNGFRALDDGQIRSLAEKLVEQVRLRGPFLSLGEFVNRRIEDSHLGRSGAIQTAIDEADLNRDALQAPFSTNRYPTEAKGNIIADTGVGIPGYLTQADVLQSLAPVMTCRSDTFVVRGYGEAKDGAGRVTARSWCEAVVQRTPEFIDPADAPDARIASLSPVNQRFGRRFEIVSFRRIPASELP